MQELENSELDLVVAGTRDAILMVEAGARMVSESMLLEALELAHSEIKKIVSKIVELQETVGRPKRVMEVEPVSDELQNQVKQLVAAPIREAVLIPGKTERQERLDQILAEALVTLGDEDPTRNRHVREIYHDLEYHEVRNMILEKKIRADGRGPCDIRPISCEDRHFASNPWLCPVYPR